MNPCYLGSGFAPAKNLFRIKVFLQILESLKIWSPYDSFKHKFLSRCIAKSDCSRLIEDLIFKLKKIGKTDSVFRNKLNQLKKSYLSLWGEDFGRMGSMNQFRNWDTKFFFVRLDTVEPPNSPTPNSHTYPNSHSLFGFTEM